MKRILNTGLRVSLITSVLLIASLHSFATHIFGVDLFYSYISGTTYQVTLVVYGDCAGAAFPSLPTSAPVIELWNGDVQSAVTPTITLAIQAPANGIEVTPVCPAQLNNTTCSVPGSSIPGIKKFIYTNTVNIPTTSIYWRFVFNGVMLVASTGNSLAGRSSNITNINGGGATIISLVDTLNNTPGSNSAPVLTTLPTPFFCLNTPANYNPGAVDANLTDSLNYSLIPGRDAATGGLVSYVPPYTASLPLATSSFSFASNTGQLNFIPDNLQKGLVVYNCEQFRNGVLVGTCQREMTFVVVDCNNNPPLGAISNPSEGTVLDATHFTVCPPLSPFTFNINPVDLDPGDNITVTSSGLPPGSTYTVTGNGTPTPIGVFAWDPTTVVPGTYNFYLTFQDDGCPLSSTQTSVFTVIIQPITNILSVTSTNATSCNIADGTITLHGLSATYAYVVQYTEGGVIHTDSVIADNSGNVTITGLPVGVYSNISMAASGCATNIVGPVTISNANIPVINTISNNGPICAGNTLDLALNSFSFPAGGVPVYSWTGPNGFVSNQQNPSIANTVAADSGNYILIVTVNGCPSAPAITDAIIYPIPAGPVITSNSPICSDSVLHLAATDITASVSYGWSGPGGFTSFGPVVTIANPVGAAGIYSVVASANGCSSPIATTTVVVNPNPVVTGASFLNPTTCIAPDGSITFSGLTAGTSYTIDYTSIFGVQQIAALATASGEVVIPGLEGGTYGNITVMAAGCPSLPLGPVTLVNPGGPAIPVATSNSPVCEDATLHLSATDDTAGVTYTWIGPGFSAPNTTQSPSIAIMTAAAAGVYTVTATHLFCNSSDTITVVMQPLPTIPVTASNSPICAGYDIQLSATSTQGASYSWSGPNGYTATGPNPVLTDQQVNASGVYSVIATLNGCIDTIPGTDTVVVKPTPPNPVGNDTIYCQFDVAGPLTGVGDSLLWYNTPLNGTGHITLIPSTAFPDITPYYVSQTINGCESLRDTMRVTVKPQPQIPVTAPNGYTYCQFETPVTTLSATGAGLLWYPPDGIVTAVAPTPSDSIPGVFIFEVTQTVNGCQSDTLSIPVTVNAKPPVPVTYDVIYCQQDIAPALSVQGHNLLWYTDSVGGVGTYNAPTPSTAATGTTTWYVTQTINACESDRGPINVTVKYKTLASFDHSNNHVCQYDTLAFTYNGPAIPPEAQYMWSATPGDSVISGNGTGLAQVKFNIKDSGTVTLTMSDTGGYCPSTASYDVVVLEAPVIGISVKPDICPEELVPVSIIYLTNNLSGFSWNFDNNEQAIKKDDQGAHYLVSWPDVGLHTIQAIAYSDSGCASLPTYATVNVHALPDARISSVSTSSVCSGDSVLFHAELNKSEWLYTWGPTGMFNNTNLPDIYGKITLTGYVTLSVTNEWGCVATDSTLIAAQPCCDVYFPNAFTPNNDTHNDVFRPVTIGHHNVHVFEITNRWGQVIYSSRDETRGWDGTFNGKPQDMDTYFYYIKFDCADGRTVEQKGDLILVR